MDTRDIEDVVYNICSDLERLSSMVRSELEDIIIKNPGRENEF